MSVGNNLQEMENVVTKNAAPGDPMPKLTTGGTPATYEDLGGPTPQNSKPMTTLTSWQHQVRR